MEQKTLHNILYPFLLTFITVALVCIAVIQGISFYHLSILENENSTLEKYDDSINLTYQYVAVIPFEGDMVTTLDSSYKCQEVVSGEIVDLIHRAKEDPYVVAVIFEIDSGGGSPVAAGEIIRAIHDLNKTTVAVIRGIGASAAYYVASSTDYIVADKNSDVGSIGVIIQYEIYNVTHETLTSVKYKDIFSTYRPLTDEEKAIAQKDLLRSHEMFVEDVALNRNLSRAYVDSIANGLSYIGIEAKRMGLIDEVGGMESALEYIEEKGGMTPTLEYYNPESKGFYEPYRLSYVKEGC